jgi:hypothetical protein
MSHHCQVDDAKQRNGDVANDIGYGKVEDFPVHVQILNFFAKVTNSMSWFMASFRQGKALF